MPQREDAHARASVVLAWLDDLYRGNGWPEGLNHVVGCLQGSGTGPTGTPALQPWTVRCPTRWELLWNSRREHSRDRRRSAGPRFAGSASVDGADADLIVEGCLYEVKTTKAPREKLVGAFRQLLGYVLLDWSHDHGLERAGFYFARQGKGMSWPLGEIVRQTTGEADATLAGLRDDFRRLAESRRETGD